MGCEIAKRAKSVNAVIPGITTLVSEILFSAEFSSTPEQANPGLESLIKVGAKLCQKVDLEGPSWEYLP